MLASPSANSGFVCGSKFQKSEILGVGAAKEVTARLAQSVERKTLNLVVVGSSPTLGDIPFHTWLAHGVPFCEPKHLFFPACAHAPLFMNMSLMKVVLE